jgi:peptidoglycan/xylan/chitin deacetylase (PgdA/CDA1 family)
MYHDVVAAGAEDTSGFKGRDAAIYKVTPERLGEHLRTIGLALPAKSRRQLVLTFDDGGASAVQAAAILEQRGFTGYFFFFITADLIGTPGFVTAADLNELAGRGHTIGSHSCTHPLRMGHCGWLQLLDEWTRSRAALCEVLGRDVRVASVPGGDFSPRVAAAAHAGYEQLFTSEPTRRTRHMLGIRVTGRFAIRRWTTPNRAAALAAGAWLACTGQAVAWNGMKVVKHLAGERYVELRRRLFRSTCRQTSTSSDSS